MSNRDACLGCGHFRNRPADIEAAMPGLTSLGSAYNSARGDDGLCLKHGRYIDARAWCADFFAIATGLTL